MQINIDKKSGIFIAVIAALVLVIAVMEIAPGRDGRGGYSGMHDMGMNKDGASSKLNGSDQMFLQMMIPHHEQAVEMSNLALTRSKNAEVLKLAQQIKDAQSAEIISMKSWLKDANMSEHMGHDMDHGMGGMMSEDEMSALTSASGSSFDTLFLKGMIAHHEGALHMVLMIQDSMDQNLRTLGENIIRTQSAEIELMKKIQG
jgi:uncharacterized protein (DUF305 family)